MRASGGVDRGGRAAEIHFGMPRYEYRCETTGEVFEVSHGMAERLGTWGEVAQRAGLPLGEVPAGAPVTKVISLSMVGGSRTGAAAMGGGACMPMPSGGCGMPSCCRMN